MAENRCVNGSLAIETKKPRVITIGTAEKAQTAKLRVAAYARVSSASDDQLNSFYAQNKYYASLISSKENWTMVDIYADEGITGTSVEKRDDFKRMISDCRKGKIDRVLVKSISRFARNTKECLETIRELKALGIGIHFEKENIDTAVMSGEMMTALFASFAQAESQSISGNMRWSYQRRMESGTYLPASMAYGYKNVDGKIEIDTEEAKVVCEIFASYLEGMSLVAIAEKISAHSDAGADRKWQRSTIAYILTNERYIGDSLWRKSFMDTGFPPRRFRNKGQVQSYYAEATHPPIISKETFAIVQTIIEQRRKKYGRISERGTALNKKIFCGGCGAKFRRKTFKGRSYWSCLTHEKDKSKCKITQIDEQMIQAAFCRLYYKLKYSKGTILNKMLISLHTIQKRRMLWSLDIIELNKRIAELTSQNQLLTLLKQQGLVDPDIFISQSNALTEQLRTSKLEKERLLDTSHDEAIKATRELIEIIENGPDFLTDFDEELFGELIDKIMVDSNDSLRFRLKNGLELRETIERTVR